MSQMLDRLRDESVARWKGEKEQRWFPRPKPKPEPRRGRRCTRCFMETAVTGNCDNCD